MNRLPAALLILLFFCSCDRGSYKNLQEFRRCAVVAPNDRLLAPNPVEQTFTATQIEIVVTDQRGVQASDTVSVHVFSALEEPLKSILESLPASDDDTDLQLNHPSDASLFSFYRQLPDSPQECIAVPTAASRPLPAIPT